MNTVKMKGILLLIFVLNSLIAQCQYDFAIYHDNGAGTWEDGIVAFEKFLDWKGLSHNRVTANDINTTEIKNNYKAIYFSGGDADYYNADINSTGILNIQEFINEGGAYIGMCAGAEFASDSLIWYDYRIDYPLDLFQGISIGPIDDIAVWPNNCMTTVTMNHNNDINQFEPGTEDILYWGGSIFSPYEDTEFDTVATFNGFNDELAIINFTYGSGRVLLISPHPEIEENSTRDGVNVASNLDDNGTDWNFLWTATDWLLGEPLTYPDLSASIINSKKQTFEVYPNPTNGIIELDFAENNIKKIKIYDITGKVVIEKTDIHQNKTIDITQFKSGLYIVILESDRGIYTSKVIKE
jgi:glutamine amidotransferase-like uncharacterized protein